MSQAIGGVKLKVLSIQALEAQHILESISKYAIDDDGDTVLCPNCESKNVELFSTILDLKSLFTFVYGVLFKGLPFYTKHKYRCADCKTEFNIK